MTEHHVTIEVLAPPSTVYDLVSDIERMGEWSPEVTRCRWIGRRTAGRVGARFRGWSRKGWRRWSTVSTVVEARRPEAFAWRVTFVRLPVATWRYQITPGAGDRTVLEEIAVDERGRLLRRASPYITGSRDRRERNDETMRTTLDRIKQAAET
jgi:hypothetical protein